MSITLPIETVRLTVDERTWRTNIETPKGVDPVVTAHREIIKTDDGGATVARDQMSIKVIRSLSSSIASGDQVTISGGTVITAEQMAEAIAGFIDLWRQQDIAAAAERGDV